MEHNTALRHPIAPQHDPTLQHDATLRHDPTPRHSVSLKPDTVILPAKPLNAVLFIICAGICLLPFMDAGLALLLGFALALIMPHPFPARHKKWSHYLLQIAVVGLGFGMNVHTALEAGRAGLWLTMASITLALCTGIYLGRRLRIGKKVAYLIAAGTAICGGSAIAAIAPLIKAKEADISIAMGTVFLLNAVALFLFPWIGHLLHMSNEQFGLWAAIANHDTSSVIGAAGKYSAQSLELATTIKLARALWIIPVSLITLVAMKSAAKPFPNAGTAAGAGTTNTVGADAQRITIPWFIFLFIGVVILNTFLPPVHLIAPILLTVARKGMVLTLFLIGSGLSPKMIRSTGAKPLALGITVWVMIATGSLWVIMHK
jgi:uncharacterized integral membrane protein (TIGR00698 family)